jgi:hypothetical protein
MNVQGLLRGYTVPQTELETYVGPGEQGQYQQSDLSNILGILSLIGAATGNVSNVQPGAVGSTQLGGSGLATLYNEAKKFFKDTDIFGNSSTTWHMGCRPRWVIYGSYPVEHETEINQ